MSRQPRQDGATSRRLVITRALDLAAAGGLQAATIGTLADTLGMSKSGVFALFGSKDALDAAVIDAAASHFERAVVAPAEAAPPGVARLAARVEGWLDAVAAGHTALAVLGLDPRGLSGAARDRLRAWRAGWRQTLRADIAEARRGGELATATDAAQAGFAARRAIEIRLQQLAAGS
jgi:AcrR family transcriptional regulator